MKKLIFLLLFGPLVLLFHSCQKELDFNQELPSLDAITPNVVNERLSFSSESDMTNYYDHLSAKIINHDNFDSVLQIKEIGYRSLREKINLATEQILNENNRQSTEDYVADEVRQSMLNEYGEISIGDFTYIYQSKNQIYKVPTIETDVILAFRNEPKGDDQYIPFEAMSATTVLISNTMSMTTDTIGTYTKTTATTTVEYFYLQHIVKQHIECEALQRRFIVHIDEHAHVFDSNGHLIHTSINHRYPGNIELNYGDNTSGYFVNEGDVIHTYPDVGSYLVSSTIFFFDRGGIFRTQFLNNEYVVIDIGCTDDATDISHWVYDVPNDRKMNTKIWFIKDIFGAHAGAHSHAYKISNGNRTQAELFVEITGTFRYTDCSFNVTKNESDHCNSCKKKRAVVSNGFLWPKRSNANGDVFSSHELNDTNGAHIEHSMVLNPCN